jgi:hypothetical protein
MSLVCDKYLGLSRVYLKASLWLNGAIKSINIPCPYFDN